MIKDDYYFMRRALNEAYKAKEIDDVPIGCVVVYNDKIIGRGYNKRNLLGDITAHAELIAIRTAEKKLGTWHLDGCKVYVTLEPCSMCAYAILASRVEELIYATSSPKYGALSYAHLFDLPFNHKVKIKKGIYEEEASKLISGFFQEKRKK